MSYCQNENTIEDFKYHQLISKYLQKKLNIKIRIHKFFKYFTGRNQALSSTVHKITHLLIHTN